MKPKTQGAIRPLFRPTARLDTSQINDLRGFKTSEHNKIVRMFARYKGGKKK